MSRIWSLNPSRKPAGPAACKLGTRLRKVLSSACPSAVAVPTLSTCRGVDPRPAPGPARRLRGHLGRFWLPRHPWPNAEEHRDDSQDLRHVQLGWVRGCWAALPCSALAHVLVQGGGRRRRGATRHAAAMDHRTLLPLASPARKSCPGVPHRHMHRVRNACSRSAHPTASPYPPHPPQAQASRTITWPTRSPQRCSRPASCRCRAPLLPPAAASCRARSRWAGCAVCRAACPWWA